MGQMDWMVRWWDVGGTGVGWTDVRTPQNGSATIGAGTGAPPLEPEWERHHWLLRGGRLWEVVDDTNRFSAARARSICVGAEK